MKRTATLWIVPLIVSLMAFALWKFGHLVPVATDILFYVMLGVLLTVYVTVILIANERDKKRREEMDNVFNENAGTAAQVIREVNVPCLLVDETGMIVWRNDLMEKLYAADDLAAILPQYRFNRPQAAYPLEIAGGTYQVMVGASVADIKLCADVKVEGTGAPNPYAGMELPSYTSGKIQQVSDAEFAALYGKEVPKQPKRFNRNSAFRDLNHGFSPIFWIVWLVLTLIYKQSMKKGTPNLNVLFIYNMPMRALAKMSGGMVSMEMVDGIVMECQGFLIIGLIRVLIGFIQKTIADSKLQKKLKAAE